jgi:hypothetical protein
VTGVRTLDGEEGAWEQHTRGIGSRLMSKMGHVPGQPLGASARAGASTTKRIFLILTVLQLAQCTLDIVSHLHRCENFVHWLSLARTAGGESSTSRFNLTKPIEIRVLPPGRSLDFISEKPKVRSLVWI